MQRKFLIFIGLLVATVFLCRAFLAKKPPVPAELRAPSPQDVVSAEPGPDADGAWIDYRALFVKRQEAALTPGSENGWALVMRALGPRAFGKNEYADEIAWEDLPNDERSRAWYANVWRTNCEKLGVDPAEKPLTYDRLTLRAHLCKYGITGRENPSQAPTLSDRENYSENRESTPGAVSKDALDACLRRMQAGPWTARDFPIAARWIDANGDLYDALSQAARTPKFGAWRVMDETRGRVSMKDDLAPVGILEFSRLFLYRANFRVGSGDFSGAADDVETVLRLARFLLDSNVATLNDCRLGLALLESALGVPFYANRSVQPSDEACARWRAVWREQFDRYDFDAALLRACENARDFFALPLAQDIIALRREGKSVSEISRIIANDSKSQDGEEPTEDAEKDSLFGTAPFDEQFLLSSLVARLRERFETLTSEDSYSLRQDAFGDPDVLKSHPGEIAFAGTLFIAANRGLEELLTDMRRVADLAKIHAITEAIQAYRRDHGGQLPPTYSIGELRKPLHSWRVLILPYFGEEERALYEKFKLDEPRGSAANAPLSDVAPECYRAPLDANASRSATRYSVVMGQEALFAYGGAARNLDAMRQRADCATDLQALVLERAIPTPWTRPDGELDAHNCRKTFGRDDSVIYESTPGGVNVGAAGGAVYTQKVRPSGPNASPAAVVETLVSGR